MSSLASIVELSTAYWQSMALLSLNQLDVFTHLAEARCTAEELSSRCGADPRSLAMLLNAGVAYGLLAKADGVYRNTDAAESFLARGRPAYLGDALRFMLDLYPLWGGLTEAVRSGASPGAHQTILGEDPDKTRTFVLGMHNRALGVARSLATSLDLSGRRRLLDVGGGPGTYSVLLAEKTPGLEATVLDLPAVVEIGRELIAASPCRDRVETREGDYNEAAFEPGYDVVLMSGMVHRETAESCRKLFAKAFGCLEPGGLVVVADIFFDDEEKSSPPFATLFALNMMLLSDHGSAFAKTEIAAWLDEAGFSEVEVRPLPPPMPHSMILAAKPAAGGRA